MDSSIKREVMERYDETSQNKIRSYLDPLQRFYYKHLFINFAINSLKRDLDEDDRVLDIGTGAGHLPYHLKTTGYDTYGIDISEEAVRAAKEYAGNPNVSYLRADSEHLCFNKGTFDGLTALGVFEYINDIDPFLAEIARVSKDGAPFVFTIINKDSYSEEGRTSEIPTVRYTKKEITEHLDKHGYTVESSQTSHFVSQYQKLLFFSERVPLPLRWLVVLGTVGINNLCQQLPIMRNHGEILLILARYKS